MDIKNLSELAKYLKPLVEEAMQKEVAETVKDTMQEHVLTDVYAEYQPKVYQRKAYDGGLIDKENMESTPVDWGVNVRNVREGNGRDVAQIVESGEGYQYEWDGMRARPFTENTVKELQSSGEHIEALKKGLKRQGLDLGGD